MAQSISIDEFHSLTCGLLGKAVTHTWQGHDTAIVLEFGKRDKRLTKNPKGEATAMLEWDWRVERNKSIFFGSGSGDQKIKNGLQTLVGQTIGGVELEGRLPELVIALSGGLWVHSFTISEKHPRWTLFLPDGNCLASRIGRVEMERCGGTGT